jgi:drug/metabolite transporter (DMT)-like permease
MPALELAGVRQLIAGILYVTFFLFRGAAMPRGKEWIPVLVLSFLNFMLSNGLSTWGVKYISAGLGSIMGAIFPLWLVVIGLFTASGKMPRLALMGLLLGFGGVCVIFYEHLQDFFNPDFRFGIILSLIATITWAFATLYTKQQATYFNPYFSLGLQMVISGVAVFSISTFDTNFISITSIPWKSWASIGYLVIFGSVIAFVCYLYALQRLPTEQASIYAYINPVVAVILGSIIFNEKVTIFLAIGGAVTLLGVYLVNKAYKIVTVEQPETEGV